MTNQVRLCSQMHVPEGEIMKISKPKFKSVVDEKINRYALIQLNKMKVKHSKSEYLKSSSFKAASYLVDSNFTKNEAQLLFKLRSKTLNVKLNFQSQENALLQENLCRTCHLFPETQGHLMQCPQIVPKLKVICPLANPIEENWMYGSLENQLKITKIYTQVLDIRNSLLENCERDLQSVTDWPVQAGEELSAVCSNYSNCKL